MILLNSIVVPFSKLQSINVGTLLMTLHLMLLLVQSIILITTIEIEDILKLKVLYRLKKCIHVLIVFIWETQKSLLMDDTLSEMPTTTNSLEFLWIIVIFFLNNRGLLKTLMNKKKIVILILKFSKFIHYQREKKQMLVYYTHSPTLMHCTNKFLVR